MKGYGQYCPVALSAEVLAERWTLLVVRELLDGSRRFNEIRNGVPKMSATLLSQRLDLLEEAGIVRKDPSADGKGYLYLPTQACNELEPIVNELGRWGQRWARGLTDADRDPNVLIWHMRSRIDRTKLPKGRTVIEFTFPDAPPKNRRSWLVCTKREVDACTKWPGFEVDVAVTTPVATMIDVWMGRRPLRSAVRAGEMQIEAPPDFRKAFPSWLRLSVAAPYARKG